MAKITMKEMFAEIITLAEDAERQDIIDFCEERINALNKKSASRSSAKAEKKAEENAPVIAEIRKVLGGGSAMTVAEMRERNTLLGTMTPQKITPVLTALAESGELTKEKVKGRMTYTLVETENEGE